MLAILASQALPIDPFWPAAAATIVLKVRLPRILAAMLVGAALSASGAAYQGIFRNPMVSPDILGVAAGASFGAGAWPFSSVWGKAASRAAAFAGGLLAVTAAYFIATWRRGPGKSVLILVFGRSLSGRCFMLSSLCSNSWLIARTLCQPSPFWLMGSLASIGISDLSVVAPPILSG